MTEEQFRIICQRLDELKTGGIEGLDGLDASIKRLGHSIDQLPTLKEIYAESFRLLIMTFGPLFIVLAAVLTYFSQR